MMKNSQKLNKEILRVFLRQFRVSLPIPGKDVVDLMIHESWLQNSKEKD